jgi:hypothetical protein
MTHCKIGGDPLFPLDIVFRFSKVKVKSFAVPTKCEIYFTVFFEKMNSLSAALRQTRPEDALDPDLPWALLQNSLVEKPIPFDRTFRPQSRIRREKYKTAQSYNTSALQPILVVYNVVSMDLLLYNIEALAKHYSKKSIEINHSWIQTNREDDANTLPLLYDIAIVRDDVPFHVANYISYSGIRTIFLTREYYMSLEFGPGEVTTNDYILVSDIEEKNYMDYATMLSNKASLAYDRLQEMSNQGFILSLVRAFHIPKI